MFESWKIGRSAETCARCGDEFPQGTAFFSALSENKGEVARTDFCPDCWEDLRAEGREFFCFWRTRRPVAEDRPQVDAQEMLDLLDRLDRPGDQQKVILRFVLALYLVRRKELKLVGVGGTGEEETLLLEKRASDEQVEVRNPHLSEEQIAAAAAQLSQAFGLQEEARPAA
ncbi:MAG: hypothetical protein R6V05_07645 [Candidatus Brocadiia bacterium]